MKTITKQSQPTKCPDCKGSGEIKGSSDQDKLIYVKNHRCHKCNGTGNSNLPEWRKKELEQADKEQKDLEKHLATKIPIELESFMSIFSDVPNKIRLKIIKSLIWTADNQEEMLNMVGKLVTSDKFRETID